MTTPLNLQNKGEPIKSTEHYEVVVVNDAAISIEGPRYVIRNRFTGVVEFADACLPRVLVTCDGFEDALTDMIKGRERAPVLVARNSGIVPPERNNH